MKIAIKLTYEEVKDIIEKEGYKLLSTEYINSLTKLEVQCPYGHTYPVNIGKFNMGRRCPYCNNRKKITKEDVDAHLYSEGYLLISEFTNSNNKMTTICPEGHKWDVTYQKFKKGRRCSKCSGKYKENKKPQTMWNTEMVKEELNKSGYILIGDYVNSITKINIMCPEGHITDKYWGHFLKGHLCKDCSNSSLHDDVRLQYGKEFVQLATSKGYSLLSNYVNTHTNILCMCKNKHYTYQTPSNFKRGKGCKGCMMSSYERRVYEILNEHYDYIVHEYVHPKLTGMRFDFAIMNSNFSQIKFLVEVDGEYHYHDKIFGNDTSLEWNRRRDEEKNLFCSNESISLVRIPYFKIKDKKWVTNQIESVTLSITK